MAYKYKTKNKYNQTITLNKAEEMGKLIITSFKKTKGLLILCCIDCKEIKYIQRKFLFIINIKKMLFNILICLSLKLNFKMIFKLFNQTTYNFL